MNARNHEFLLTLLILLHFQSSWQSTFTGISLVVDVITTAQHRQRNQSILSQCLHPPTLAAVSTACSCFVQALSTGGALTGEQQNHCYRSVLLISSALLSVVGRCCVCFSLNPIGPTSLYHSSLGVTSFNVFKPCP